MAVNMLTAVELYNDGRRLYRGVVLYHLEYHICEDIHWFDWFPVTIIQTADFQTDLFPIADELLCKYNAIPCEQEGYYLFHESPATFYATTSELQQASGLDKNAPDYVITDRLIELISE